ncbi:serine hydrolase [Mitsuaria sp. GD03876]|uniref:serine hydrolase n=1 Tax=Mitsuaria sp. GD03876 TaxID=2975399 RepID=UPI0024481071|nr:serine hydrolase [Mitsuaria sp. GD03876]MDH0866130.1 serine hydrolase [Mitsuaria sp. GD03876]
MTIRDTVFRTLAHTNWRLALPALALTCGSLIVQAASEDPEVVVPTASPTTAAISPSGVVTPAPPAASVPAPAASFPPVAQSPTAIPPLPVPAPSETPLMKLPVNARHMLVIDDTGRVLMAKDADAVVPIASLTKLMTAMVVLDARQDMREEIRIDDADVDRLKHSRSRVRVGATMSREAALELALISSENRAASALARHFPGGLPAYEAAVAAKIRALGLAHTALADPTGLSPNNTSTAAEVARIAAAAARYPAIARISSDKSSEVEVNGRPRELRNTNHLVGAKGWDIRLSKTGYTEEAGRCLAMRMKSGGQTITVVLLDADGSAQRLRDAAAIRKSLAKLT